MEVFVFAGSGQGSGRTTASLLLACGFFEMGLEPLLIQVLATGEPPALRADEEAPFETARLVLADASSIGSEIKDLAGRHTELGPVIVDLPAQLFPEELLCDPRSRFLLPMMTDKAAIQRVVGDMLDVFGRDQPDGYARTWILPTRWPSILRREEYVAVLNRALARCGQGSSVTFHIIQPGGIPELYLGFEPILVEGRIVLSPLLMKAVAMIAYSVLRATGSSLIEFPENAFLQ
ncbi:hypothetical protein ARD30_21665 [Bosea thiooxidans]|uniref:CobQ/CobB/MinD/ParA nucleotide binding domain-containing protein n=1 Tax=Bosea thiooxidans TaxID=53254 RepID=A0A0Q3PFA1_9HYPH|nr:hypothetical protein [Bosea thiooxidans]KQK28438.1 hypothetical protein ARD30_21665 [Bosea thiooxidans]